MKKTFLFSLLIAATTIVAGCGGVDVVNYNDKIVDLANKCLTAENLMWSAIEEENYDSAKTLYTTSLETCASVQANIAALDSYKEDGSLRDAADALLQAEIAYLQKFGDVLTYREYDELTPEQEAAYTAIQDELSTIEAEVTVANTNFVTIQETFSTTHGYELEE
ncbi:MAG: hypothetical protein LBD75_01820 [Candidatus Peribacteria bacterium]|jgi:hypothetical protein|nr:hypothetical protein [Candidatus Peribacteria bacterium]